MSGRPLKPRDYPGRRIVTSRDIATAVALPTDGLVSYWTLDEPSGTRFDSHGSNHLTPTNAPASAAGKQGNAGDFESSSSQYLSHPDPTPLGDEDFTYTLWFKRDVITAGQLVAKDAVGARSFFLQFEASDRLLFTFGSDAAFLLRPGTITDTNWHFLVAWHDAVANTMHLQLDNSTVAAAATGGVFPPAAAIDVRIGARQYTGYEQHFDGLIDEVGLWRRVLTTQERTLLWNDGDGITYATMMDVLLTDADRDVTTPYTFASEILPFRIRVDPAVYYHPGFYYEHIATDAASGLWIYAPTR